MAFCYPVIDGTVTFQKSAVHFPAWLVHHNVSHCAPAYITFVLMHRNKARYFIEFISHALFWAGVYYVLHSLTASSFSMLVYSNGKVSHGINARMLFPYPEVVLGVLMLMFYGNIFWLFKKLIRHKNNGGGVAVIAGWFVLLFALNYLVVRMLTDPPSGAHPGRDTALPGSLPTMIFSLDTLPGSPSDSVHRLKVDLPSSPPHTPPPPPEMAFSADDWWSMQLVMAIVFLAVLGIAVAYFFIKEWIRNDLVRSQAEAHQLSTEVRFLRSQVNPHFLFNTLNNLFSMAQKNDNDELADGILKLSGMMRYMIYESNIGSVPLQKEIDYLKDCIALNKLRYADSEASIRFQYPQQNEIVGVQVAPMLFIPFLENAFKHGVSIGHNSSIVMSITVNQKKLIFACENPDYSAVKKLGEEQTGIGLENVRRRLQLIYPGNHTLQAGPENGKYCATLQINLV